MTKFLDDFLSDIPRGVATRYLKQQSVPQARWQLPQDIMRSAALSYDPAHPGGKILIGALDDKLIGIEDNRHVLTVAGSRSGKSVTLVGNLLFYNGSVLALDPKAELADITAARREALGQDVHVLDPFNYACERIAHLRASYNPLSALKPDSPTLIEDASLIADAMVVQGAGNKDPHWDESAKNFIEGVILHVITDPTFEGERHLLTVRELIKTAMKPDEQDEELCELERAMLENAERLQGTEKYGRYRRERLKARRVISTKRATGSGTAFCPRSGVTPSFWTIRGCAMFSRKAILIWLPSKATHGASLFICAFPRPGLRLPDAGCASLSTSFWTRWSAKNQIPLPRCLVCLDEFPVLGYMKQLENAAGQIASFGVKLWVLLQDWGQGKALYGERWETFTGNAGLLQFFGNNDVCYDGIYFKAPRQNPR